MTELDTVIEGMRVGKEEEEEEEEEQRNMFPPLSHSLAPSPPPTRYSNPTQRQKLYFRLVQKEY